MNRRSFLKQCALTTGTIGAAGSILNAGVQIRNNSLDLRVGKKRPNIIFIMIDDSGVGDFECYHPNTPVLTPNIMNLASRGVRFTNAYTPGVVCGPTRSCLMTGYHLGHCSMRGNFNSACIHPDDVTIPEVMKKAGYATGGYGKWGIGSPGTPTAPELKGFDEYIGHYHQIHAHDHYVDRLYLNGQTYMIPENTGAPNPSTGIISDNYTHQQNIIFEKMTQFIKTNAAKDKPFFVYGAWTLPHSDNTIPEAETQPGGAYAPYSSKSWAESAKIQAAFMTWLDRQIGQIVDLLEDPNQDGNNDDSITDNTVIVFSSDNGGAEGAVGSAWDRNYPLRGQKGSLNEGGIRTPMICVWPGKIKPNTTTDILTYLVDMMATFADLAGVQHAVPEDTDGISIVPTLTGKGTQKKHEGIYIQIHNIQPNGSKSEMARMDIGSHKWKAIRNTSGVTSLYDLAVDVHEDSNISSSNPSVVSMMESYMDAQHTKMRPQFNVNPPSVGNSSRNGIVVNGIRPASSARDWHLSESGDALSLSGQLRDNSNNAISLYLDDLYKDYQIELDVTVNGASKPDLDFSIKGVSNSEFYLGTMSTSSVSSGNTETLSMTLDLTDVTPGESNLRGDLGDPLTLYVSHSGSSGDISVNNIAVTVV